MNGAESLVQTLVDSGISVCFANPGTSEMHFVAALDRIPGIRSVLCLFEGVVTGAADGYGRMAGKPACTLLHLGPGLANGLANLHNARRAASPIVNIIGDHATYHAQYDAPLASDIMGFARPVSGWLHQSTSVRDVAYDGARAVAAALAPPGQIASLILPADTAWLEEARPAPRLPVSSPSLVDDQTIELAAAALKSAKKPMVLIRGTALLDAGLTAAGRLAAATGARLACDTFAPRMRRGAGLVSIERIPYFAEQIVDFMAGCDLLVLVGAKPPVSFFAYPGKPSWCTPDDARIITLAQPAQDGTEALVRLASAVHAPLEPAHVATFARPDQPTGKLNAFSVGQAIARLLPDNAIISDEAATSGLGANHFMLQACPHDHLALTGGAIGQGIPVGTGAALACPGRKVICLQGDGGAMYTLQALWTQARERLDVINIIFANHSYGILNVELMRVGALNPGPTALSMLDLSNPKLDWLKLSEGMGVPAYRATNIEEFCKYFEHSTQNDGPHLIEVVI